MNKIEIIYRELLYNTIEKRTTGLTQAYLATALHVSLSTVNLAMKPLARMNAVRVKRRGFDVIDAKKILLYWASVRNVEKDVIYATRVNVPVMEIEKQMPDDIVFTAYSGYKLKFKDVPADYSEVYVYGAEETKKRWKESAKQPNLFVLKKDKIAEKYGKTASLANLFVDLWNLRQWYAKDFLKALEVKIDRILEQPAD